MLVLVLVFLMRWGTVLVAPFASLLPDNPDYMHYMQIESSRFY